MVVLSGFRLFLFCFFYFTIRNGFHRQVSPSRYVFRTHTFGWRVLQAKWGLQCSNMLGKKLWTFRIKDYDRWNYPRPSNSHHQDYFLFVGNPYKPSFMTAFMTVTGWGVDRRYPPSNLSWDTKNGMFRSYFFVLELSGGRFFAWTSGFLNDNFRGALFEGGIEGIYQQIWSGFTAFIGRIMEVPMARTTLVKVLRWWLQSRQPGALRRHRCCPL